MENFILFYIFNYKFIILFILFRRKLLWRRDEILNIGIIGIGNMGNILIDVFLEICVVKFLCFIIINWMFVKVYYIKEKYFFVYIVKIILEVIE